MKWSLIVILLLCFFDPLYAQEQKSVNVLYLKIQQQERPTLSNLDPIPQNLGLKGAELGAADNNTTGSFLGYQFQLDVKQFGEGDIEAVVGERVWTPRFGGLRAVEGQRDFVPDLKLALEGQPECERDQCEE